MITATVTNGDSRLNLAQKPHDRTLNVQDTMIFVMLRKMMQNGEKQYTQNWRISLNTTCLAVNSNACMKQGREQTYCFK